MRSNTYSRRNAGNGPGAKLATTTMVEARGSEIGHFVSEISIVLFVVFGSRSQKSYIGISMGLH